MSLNSNVSAVNRFTYDWLIRFIELHPLKMEEYFNVEYRKHWVTVNHNELRPDDYLSKYVAISPMFTNLINRYMPYAFYYYAANLDIIKAGVFICSFVTTILGPTEVGPPLPPVVEPPTRRRE
uniref:Anoctamin n=1 Tax=Panagrellus redivivus TaxID=6233 RepID=A0A7E4UY75_PANRE